MSSVKTIEETALAWSVKAMSGEMSSGETEALKRWLSADSRHAAAYEEYAGLDGFLDDVAFAAAAEEGAEEVGGGHQQERLEQEKGHFKVLLADDAA